VAQVQLVVVQPARAVVFRGIVPNGAVCEAGQGPQKVDERLPVGGPDGVFSSFPYQRPDYLGSGLEVLDIPVRFLDGEQSEQARLLARFYFTGEGHKFIQLLVLAVSFHFLLLGFPFQMPYI
jgi:hypothetical protein